LQAEVDRLRQELQASEQRNQELAEQIAALQEENKQTREMQNILIATVENSPDFIGIATPDARAIYVNKAGQEMVGLTDEEAVRNTNITDYFFPEDLAYVQEHIMPVLMETGNWRSPFRLRKFDTGEAVPIDYNLFLVRDEETGEVIAIPTVSRDIRDQQKYEAELRTYYALAENAPDAVAVGTMEGVLTYVNPAYRSISGYGDDIIGINVAELYAGSPDSLQQIFQNLMANGVWQGLWPFKRKDGTTFPSQLSAFLIRDTNGEAIGLGAIMRDITFQMQAEQERARLQEEIIETQRKTLREVSIPLIPLTERAVLVPLIGSIDSDRAQQFLETLLEGIAHHQSDMAIVDITGVSVVDTQVAQALLQTAQAAQLLGARVMLTGVKPQIAQTMVHLEVDTHNILVKSSVQHGIAYALQYERGNNHDQGQKPHGEANSNKKG
jgi:rsbT co-antagonist protein RsbR